MVIVLIHRPGKTPGELHHGRVERIFDDVFTLDAFDLVSFQIDGKTSYFSIAALAKDANGKLVETYFPVSSYFDGVRAVGQTR